MGRSRLAFGETLAHFLRGFLADHIAAVDIGDVAEKARDRIPQSDLERIGIDSVGANDTGEVIRIGRRRLICGALDGIGSVFRGELSIVPMALHAMSDFEDPFRACGVGAPALGKVRLDRVRADLTGLHAHQAVEHILQQPFVGCGRGDMRIELPASAEPMPMTRVFFCAAASPATRKAAKASPATKIFRIGSSLDAA